MPTPEPATTKVFLCHSKSLSQTPEKHNQSLKLIGASEHARLTQYQGRRYREFLQTRTLLRHALSATLPHAAAPENWQISERPEQALLVHQAAEQGWHYSLSHSRDRIAVAISNAGPCGIDLEYQRPRANLLALAGLWFHPSEAQYLANLTGEEQLAAFYRLWTLKEALIKASGSSMFSGILADTCFRPCDGAIPDTGLTAHHLALPSEPYSLALVCAGPAPANITDGCPLTMATPIRPAVTSYEINPITSNAQATSGRSM